MVTKKQKPTVHSQKNKEKGIKAHHYGKIINTHIKTAKEGERNTGTTKQSENNKMPLVNPYLLIITLYVNELNIQNKRHREAGWIKKKDRTIFCLPETHFKDIHRLRVKGWKIILHAIRSEREKS